MPIYTRVSDSGVSECCSPSPLDIVLNGKKLCCLSEQNG